MSQACSLVSLSIPTLPQVACSGGSLLEPPCARLYNRRNCLAACSRGIRHSRLAFLFLGGCWDHGVLQGWEWEEALIVT